ncbi:MAG: chromate transporter [Treponema sp.]|jgi:chromate transporter|nr:chromate transporter [Treponema sp.]
MEELLDIFITFLKMGCITFGGGYAMIPVVEREIIGKKGWITMDEAMDYYTIAQVTPGIIAVNVSTFIGYKRKGAIGGLIATIGFVLPGVMLVTAAALCVARFADHPAVRHAFTGVRAAVGALILDMVIKLCAGFFPKRSGTANHEPAESVRRTYLALLIFLIAFSLSAFFSIRPVPLVMAAGLAGFFLYGGFFSKFLKKNKGGEP